MKRHRVPTPSSDLSFWAAVHKMRLSLPAFTDPEREESRAWLSARGMLPKPAIPENLRLHMRVFGAKLAELEARGVTGGEAGIAAAKEANRLHPLTDEDKEALRTAGDA